MHSDVKFLQLHLLLEIVYSFPLDVSANKL